MVPLFLIHLFVFYPAMPKNKRKIIIIRRRSRESLIEQRCGGMDDTVHGINNNLQT